LRVAPDEPALALCGVDNLQARELLEGAGFANVFEAGLGDGASDFRLIRTHSFPAPVGAAAIWANRSTADVEERQSLPSAYRDLRDRGKLDQCGLTRLAEIAVGAPFVGMVAAAVVVAQVIRMTVDGMRPTVCNLDLTCLQHRSVVMREGNDAIVFKTTKA
ncbi:hypothetical protein, partial [Acidisphaera sp. L21]|uniref:hypothetical protein n=1 Tax=Acidisphaera sp. L21 TaxID=1641851 RepID=UPI001C20875A